MNPELEQTDYSDSNPSAFVTGTEAQALEVNVKEPGAVTVLLPASTASSGQWQQIGEQLAEFFAELPAYLLAFFRERPLTSFGLVIGAAVAVKLTLAVLDALNDIPLVSPTFEVIGIAYTTWFIYRYLLKAANRQELSEEIKSLKTQVLGKNSSLN